MYEHKLKKIIESSFQNLADIHPSHVDIQTLQAVNQVMDLLDRGLLRVTKKIQGQWITQQWVKKSIFLFFLIHKNKVIQGAESQYFDKVPMKFANYDEEKFNTLGARIVPPAAIRYGAFIARNTVLMPSYVNVGAFIDEGTMIDTWATVGILWNL